ncbi:MAG: archaellin/type IV pilin N-terminal domain-containing protein [Dehalococcoidia bacterium]
MVHFVHLCSRLRSFSGKTQRGITGLETAIVLIAFVVVSSVFAFAALSTGLFTTDKAKDTIKAGLSEARGTMEMKGSIIATASTTGNSGIVSDLTFQVTNAAAGEAIDMSVGNTIIKYSDNNQVVNLDTAGEFTATGIGSDDGDSLLERGEVFEVVIPGLNSGGANPLGTELTTDTTFTLEVIPPRGAVLFIQRTTPISLESRTSLD